MNGKESENMVNLRAKPYNLGDEDIAWVENTIASMTDEEKVGQLFWQLTASQEEGYLRELMDKYHLGGCRYNGMPGQKVLEQNRILQKYAKIPVFIACNPETGGNGVCSGGTSLCIALALGERLTAADARAVIGALLLGFVAYGLSIFFYIYAQRGLGAARTSAYYAVAPFIGVALSMLLCGERPGAAFFIALAVMAAGTYFASVDPA